jgi:retinol dehydrogenase-12
MDHVRELGEKLAALARIDVLINNAGATFWRRQTTAYGLERTFALNHLSYFLLTALLRPRLVASAPARVVNVASEAHRNAVIDFDDLMGERRYNGLTAYNRSKLCNILFTRELARRLAGTGVAANAVHPGVVATHIVRGAPFFVRWWFRVFGLSPEQGAAGPLMLATAPQLAAVAGRYFNRTREASPSRAAGDPEAAARLWEVCEQLTGPA